MKHTHSFYGHSFAEERRVYQFSSPEPAPTAPTSAPGEGSAEEMQKMLARADRVRERILAMSTLCAQRGNQYLANQWNGYLHTFNAQLNGLTSQQLETLLNGYEREINSREVSSAIHEQKSEQQATNALKTVKIKPTDTVFIQFDSYHNPIQITPQTTQFGNLNGNDYQVDRPYCQDSLTIKTKGLGYSYSINGGQWKRVNFFNTPQLAVPAQAPTAAPAAVPAATAAPATSTVSPSIDTHHPDEASKNEKWKKEIEKNLKDEVDISKRITILTDELKKYEDKYVNDLKELLDLNTQCRDLLFRNSLEVEIHSSDQYPISDEQKNEAISLLAKVKGCTIRDTNLEKSLEEFIKRETTTPRTESWVESPTPDSPPAPTKASNLIQPPRQANNVPATTATPSSSPLPLTDVSPEIQKELHSIQQEISRELDAHIRVNILTEKMKNTASKDVNLFLQALIDLNNQFIDLSFEINSMIENEETTVEWLGDKYIAVKILNNTAISNPLQDQVLISSLRTQWVSLQNKIQKKIQLMMHPPFDVEKLQALLIIANTMNEAQLAARISELINNETKKTSSPTLPTAPVSTHTEASDNTQEPRQADGGTVAVPMSTDETFSMNFKKFKIDTELLEIINELQNDFDSIIEHLLAAQEKVIITADSGRQFMKFEGKVLYRSPKTQINNARGYNNVWGDLAKGTDAYLIKGDSITRLDDEINMYREVVNVIGEKVYDNEGNEMPIDLETHLHYLPFTDKDNYMYRFGKDSMGTWREFDKHENDIAWSKYPQSVLNRNPKHTIDIQTGRVHSEILVPEGVLVSQSVLGTSWNLSQEEKDNVNKDILEVSSMAKDVKPISDAVYKGNYSQAVQLAKKLLQSLPANHAARRSLEADLNKYEEHVNTNQREITILDTNIRVIQSGNMLSDEEGTPLQILNRNENEVSQNTKEPVGINPIFVVSDNTTKKYISQVRTSKNGPPNLIEVKKDDDGNYTWQAPNYSTVPSLSVYTVKDNYISYKINTESGDLISFRRKAVVDTSYNEVLKIEMEAFSSQKEKITPILKCIAKKEWGQARTAMLSVKNDANTPPAVHDFINQLIESNGNSLKTLEEKSTLSNLAGQFSKLQSDAYECLDRTAFYHTMQQKDRDDANDSITLLLSNCDQFEQKKVDANKNILLNSSERDTLNSYILPKDALKARYALMNSLPGKYEEKDWDGVFYDIHHAVLKFLEINNTNTFFQGLFFRDLEQIIKRQTNVKLVVVSVLETGDIRIDIEKNNGDHTYCFGHDLNTMNPLSSASEAKGNKLITGMPSQIDAICSSIDIENNNLKVTFKNGETVNVQPPSSYATISWRNISLKALQAKYDLKNKIDSAVQEIGKAEISLPAILFESSNTALYCFILQSGKIVTVDNNGSVKVEAPKHF